MVCSGLIGVMAQVDIDTVEKFEALRQTEKDYFTDMVKRCKDSGATLIICQWGFDDEANHLLLANDLPGVLCSHSIAHSSQNITHGV